MCACISTVPASVGIEDIPWDSREAGLPSKIHAVVDTNGLPVRLALTAGEAHDNRLAVALSAPCRALRLTSFTKERYLPASAGMVKGTRQTSCAYSPMARSEENHAMLAIFMMHIRVQSDGDRHSPSMRRCVAK